MCYVSNKSLGIKRPPTAFSLYLKSTAGQARRHVGTRIYGKTTAFRMDCLRQKFESLETDLRQPYVAAAVAANEESQNLRQAALRKDGKSEPKASGSQVKDQSEPIVLLEPEVAGPQAGPSGETIAWADPESGARICFAVLGVLGRGVLGVAKKAVDVDAGETFCAKFPTDEPTANTALQAEWAFMMRCDHPNVTRVIGAIADGKTIKVLLTPLMLGNLWHFSIDRDGSPTDPRLLAQWERSCLIQICSGLIHTRSRSIFHFDLKPENVLVQQQPRSPGHVFRISDFGNAHALLDLLGRPSTSSTLLHTDRYICSRCEARSR